MYEAMDPSGSAGPARSTFTDEPSSSRTSLRESRTRSFSVLTFMPWETFAEHDGASTRPPVSTTHRRHTPSGSTVSPWHSVGMSMPWARHAWRIVVPAATVTGSPSIVSSTCFGAGRAGRTGSTGERAGWHVKMTQSTPV